MKAVIDASVAIKWYVEQPFSLEARQLAASDHVLIAPELILAEAGNTLWKYVRAGQIEPPVARSILCNLAGRLDELQALASLADDALEIAILLNHPVYDCFYLALARREGAPVVTADKRLATAAQMLPGLEVRLLGA
jgi:predicted nucleic acid-binding protein